MTKRMLIDASHAEETRVVVLDGSRLEDFDVETATKKQLKGNIYLAKIVRVEPSLQAAFVEYGGNRHGFLAFGEIHPDYYQIPVADRQRLVAMQEEEARAEAEAEEEEDRGPERSRGGERGGGERGGGERGGGERGGGERGAREERGNGRKRPAVTQALPIARAMMVAPEEAAGEFPEAAAVPAPTLDVSAEAVPEGRDPFATDTALDTASDTAADVTEAASGMVEAGLPGDGSVLDDSVAAQAGHHAPAMQADGAGSGLLHGGGMDAEAGGALAEAPDGEDQEAHDRAFADPADAAESRAEAGDGDVESPAELHGTVEPLDALQGEDAGEPSEPPPETLNGRDAGEDRERKPSRFLRNYKIQEVIRRRQIILIQVVKEERGTKGAALTTYISLAGRFSVLMPNSPRGGGVSRKITSAADRRRLKEITNELDLPRGMGMIVRTAGAQRPKPEIKRDGEYLLRLWDDIRETTLASTAPALIHEEASLIKRAIRDVYSRDVDEVLVDGEDAWRAARDYMRMLMPAHARKVQLWRDTSAASAGQPLFAAERVEAQLDAMLSPTVQLKSGGYLVINQTEALVAVDVNSGRSTRERGIEETALRTNLEAADEVARQLRLRDLAGLIVIDFIDMEARRHNAAVEKRLKDALRDDRARIQLGHISHFGLMEMSRQRLRPSLAETAFVACPHCGGTGHVRSTENACLHVLRAIEEEGAKRRAAEIVVHVASATALYVLNHKRDRVAEIEARYAMSVAFAADESLLPAQTRIDRVRPQTAPFPVSGPAGQPNGTVLALDAPASRADQADDAEVEEPDVEEAMPFAAVALPEKGAVEPGAGEADGAVAAAEAAEQESQRKRRRRRRRGARPEGEAGAEPAAFPEDAEQPSVVLAGEAEEPAPGAEPVAELVAEPVVEPAAVEAVPEDPADPNSDEDGARRRRGRRGGRRRRREGGEEPATEAVPVYTGPTPADPFGAPMLDIFEMAELAEQREAMLARMPEAVAPYAPASQPTAAVALDADVAPPVAVAFPAAVTFGADVMPDAGLVGTEPVGTESVGTEPFEPEPAPPALVVEPALAAAVAPPAEAAFPESQPLKAPLPAVEPESDTTPTNSQTEAASPVGEEQHHAAEDATPAVAATDATLHAATLNGAHAAAPSKASGKPSTSEVSQTLGNSQVPADEALSPEPVGEASHAEPVTSAPPIRPIMVGSTEAAEKKRGWWRR